MIRILWIIFFCLLLFLPLRAEINITLGDTSIARGDIISYPVYITAGIESSQNIKIVLEYNAYVISIDTARGGNDYVFRCNYAELTTDYTSIEQAKCEIYCDDLSPETSQIMCTLDIEGLAGPDSVSVLRVKEIWADGTLQASGQDVSARVVVSGVPIFQRLPEGLGQNYPNPFAWRTVFPVILESDTELKFSLYSIHGALVLTGTDNSDMFKLFDEKRNIIDIGAEVPKGNYTLEFIIDTWYIASGVYFLTMETGKSAYSRSFIINKD